MKKIYFIGIFLAVVCLLPSLQTATSLPFSGSYLMRAQGAEAVYWNPASLNSNYKNFVIPVLNLTGGIFNNAFDLDTYNFFCSRDTLSEKDKARLLSKIDSNLRFKTDENIMLFGMTFGNLALASGTHIAAHGRFDKDYLRIILYGNEETDYFFTKEDNQVEGLVYQDITLGAGNWNISPYFKLPVLPAIKVGASASILIGGAVAETDKFIGTLHSDFDGMQLKQDVYLRTGILGIGTKALLGVKSEPLPNLSVGMSLDNIGGFIKWVGENKMYHYNVESDSVFAADLEEDFVTEVDSSWSIGNFTTKIPPELRLGAYYSFRKINVSADYVQGFKASQVTSPIGYFCFGAEFLPLPVLPLQIGYRPGNKDQPWSFSYGIGIRVKPVNLGIGIQSISSIIPGYKTRGVNFAGNFSIHY
ncbi:MAG TPA: hypothetical protein PLF50_04060 [Candidatus Cloacimonadota bacterium]|nr:hypothetical protein [Candidatus Cloacimonadota bacterium]